MSNGFERLPPHGAMLYFKVHVGAMGATKVEVVGQAEGDEEFVALVLHVTQRALMGFEIRN